MEWSVNVVDGALVGRTSGIVNEKNWQQFEPLVIDALRQATAAGQPFVLDMARIPHMSSRGLRVLTAAREEALKIGGEIKLANPVKEMREILDITAFDEIFEIIETPGATA